MNQVTEIRSINPNTGEILGTVPIMCTAEVRAAVQLARTAQKAWAARPLTDRIAVLRRVQESLVEEAQQIATLVSKETGKSLTEAYFEDVLLVLADLKGYLRLAPRVLAPKRLNPGLLHITKKMHILQEPLGVVAVISPFNFPVLLSMKAAFAALVSGNAVVQKPSEFTPLTAHRIADALHRSGIPRDLLQVVTGDGSTGAALLASGVDHVFFVGSTRTGRKVAQAAGEHLISKTLELGGNNAMILLDDAPVSRAVDAALTYAYGNNGQMCGAISQIFVHKSIADNFIEILQHRVKAIRASTSVAPGLGEVTSLVSERALQKVDRQVQETVARGAEVLAGGKRLEDTGAPVYQPTILVEPANTPISLEEEIFGPVILVRKITDEQEAISKTNASPYGLTASVWTMDNRRAWRVAHQLEVASVAVNDHLWPFFSPYAPWGGVKDSGVGRIGGEWGLKTMTTPKVICFDRLNLQREFYWFPTTRRIFEVIRSAIPALYSTRLKKRLGAIFGLLRILTRKQTSTHPVLEEQKSEII